MYSPDILAAIQPVVHAFETLSIPYYIGGSIASSLYGIARATMDVDVVADIKETHISSLIPMLEEGYFIDEDMINNAINMISSFNLIHLKTMIKIDVFIHTNREYPLESMRRIRKDTLEETENADEFYFCSPEDIILNKLHWYLLGDRISERQWFDITGVIKVQGKKLDIKYLQKWSKFLGLSDLIDQAFQEAGVDFDND